MEFGFGGGTLWGTRTDIAGGTPLKFGALQDVTLDFSGDLKELYGQNQYALALARGKTKVELKAKFAQIQGLIVNSLYFGGTFTATGSQVGVSESEGGAIPATSAYTVTVANSATFLADLGVYYASTGLPFTRVASGPTVGQYSVAAGVYTFAAADASKAVLLNYTYTITGGGPSIAIGNPRMGTTPTFSCVFSQPFGGQQATFQLNNCASSKLSFPTKQDDWLINELDFMVAADASNNIGTISFSQ
jgi:hypothetical protein